MLNNSKSQFKGFLKNLDKVFHEFKLLKINSRRKIETRLSFVFPKHSK